MVDASQIGPVLGSVSPVVADLVQRYNASRARYDVAIAGLPFAKMPSDQRPYARETAQFRKEQFDAAQQAGDQSLTGFWTRGQFSFHKGAGIKYYETLDGETILNRFSDSAAVDPWTAGELTLGKGLVQRFTTDAARVVNINAEYMALRTSWGIEVAAFGGTSATQVPGLANGTDATSTGGSRCFFAVNDAIKEMATPTATSAMTLITRTGGTQIKRVWWAKDRLFFLDATGRWFAKAAVSGSVADADSFWSSPLGYTDDTHLVDTPASVLIGTEGRIYAIGLDGTGNVPTLASPVVVGVLPRGERIQSLAYSGSLVLIGTQVGLRAGLLQGDGLTLGPVFIEGNCTRVTVGGLGRCYANVDGTLYEIRTEDSTNDLEPVYARFAEGTWLDIAGSASGQLVALSGTAAWGSTDIASTGSLVTGFHRFGTMEAKVFHSLTLRVVGSKGTVAVSVVFGDGSSKSVVTLASDKFGAQEIALNMPDTTEVIGLRFDLTSQDGQGPTLLGYQLRALPAPTRQRVVQVPLQCWDIEDIKGIQTGGTGWAWSRLQALEDLERTSGLVTYQDFNLKETSLAYIEQLQFQNTTPPQTNDSGFGGFLVATLRLVT